MPTGTGSVVIYSSVTAHALYVVAQNLLCKDVPKLWQQMRSPFQCDTEFARSAPVSYALAKTQSYLPGTPYTYQNLAVCTDIHNRLQSGLGASKRSEAWGTCPACSNVTRRCAALMQHPHASPIRGSCRAGTTSCPMAPPQSGCFGRGSGTGWERTAPASP